MQISSDLITGLALGIEYVEANEDADIPHSVLIFDLLVLRVIVEFTDS
jgi:hypothetical protein